MHTDLSTGVIRSGAILESGIMTEAPDIIAAGKVEKVKSLYKSLRGRKRTNSAKHLRPQSG